VRRSSVETDRNAHSRGGSVSGSRSAFVPVHSSTLETRRFGASPANTMTTPTMSTRHLVGMVLLLAVVFGCRARTLPQPDSMTLSVDNRSEFQVNVFAVPSVPSARIRLGSVGPLSTGRLALPERAIGPGGALTLMADPIGSTSQWTSNSVTVSADTRPCLRLQANAFGDLSQSSLSTQLGSGSTCP
jgi:hypothetical protein